ncbi:CLUMA_CG015982, isoform A [Clunio marinus]|uniref:CLUMA_CG015982, isoform A n=1 Tax=Clunio marinus TaxID=568069 RepID=A0A1J1IRB5_9DIPT|nr:CLUMA_CG015982, isoform A [Clunio marinus]
MFNADLFRYTYSTEETIKKSTFVISHDVLHNSCDISETIRREENEIFFMSRQDLIHELRIEFAESVDH